MIIKLVLVCRGSTANVVNGRGNTHASTQFGFNHTVGYKQKQPSFCQVRRQQENRPAGGKESGTNHTQRHAYTEPVASNFPQSCSRSISVEVCLSTWDMAQELGKKSQVNIADPSTKGAAKGDPGMASY